jgi:hypothetical protein
MKKQALKDYERKDAFWQSIARVQAKRKVR